MVDIRTYKKDGHLVAEFYDDSAYDGNPYGFRVDLGVVCFFETRDERDAALAAELARLDGTAQGGN